MKRHNIFIIGGSLSNNEGAAAMTIVAANLAKKIIPESNIMITTPYLKEDSQRNKFYNYKLILNEHIIILQLVPGIITQFFRIGRKLRMIKSFWESDLIIDITGDYYSDDYGYFNSFHFIKELICPIIFKKPIIIFPQSLGPFNSKFTYNFAKFIFNHCKIVIAREKITKNILDDMNLKTRVELIDDAAFLLKPVSKDKLNNIIKLEKIIKDKMLIGVSLSQSIANYSKTNTSDKYDEYLQIMINLVNYLTELGRVVLISHVGGEANRINDDLIISKNIYKKAKNVDRITFINRRYRPDEWKGIISVCDIFIGARMHANIAALSTNVPTIAIAYSHKFYGIMDSYSQSKYVCDIMKINREELIKKVNELLHNKKEIIDTLKKKNSTIPNNEKILSSIIIDALKNKN